MKIQIGSNYVNKTWKYLFPCLRGYGNTFVTKFNVVYKLGVGIFDSVLEGSDEANGRNIYILLDKKYQEKAYQAFIDYIEYQDYFVARYCGDSDLNSRKEMIVLKIPTEFSKAYDNFLLGKYSKMYTNSQVKDLFSSPERKEQFDILTKNPNYVIEFQKRINNIFGTSIEIDNLENIELDTPLERKQEIFNCPNAIETFVTEGSIVEMNRIFFDIEKDKLWLTETLV